MVLGSGRAPIQKSDDEDPGNSETKSENEDVDRPMKEDLEAQSEVESWVTWVRRTTEQIEKQCE